MICCVPCITCEAVLASPPPSSAPCRTLLHFCLAPRLPAASTCRTMSARARTTRHASRQLARYYSPTSHFHAGVLEGATCVCMGGGGITANCLLCFSSWPAVAAAAPSWPALGAVFSLPILSYCHAYFVIVYHLPRDPGGGLPVRIWPGSPGV